MKNALILSGGGARAAYQVGVLKGLAELLPASGRPPFPIICGTSAGAINAVTLAAHEGSFTEAVTRLEALWLKLEPASVYHCGCTEIVSGAGRLLLSLVNRGVGLGQPLSLLNNAPLRDLIRNSINFEHIDRAIGRGDLDAVSVTATGYNDGRSVSFFQGRLDIGEWSRYRRRGRRTLLNTDHLMASSAIPTMFPATRIEFDYYGDGAMRQLAPLSPALHLGADRLLIIGVSGNRVRDLSAEMPGPAHSPSIAQIIGHMLNSAFIDSLESDIERLERINQLIGMGHTRTSPDNDKMLRRIEHLVISPSEDLDSIAADCVDALPASVRFLLRATGGTERGGGSTAASYLLFARPFVTRLVDLGYGDAMAMGDEIIAFHEESPPTSVNEEALQHSVGRNRT